MNERREPGFTPSGLNNPELSSSQIYRSPNAARAAPARRGGGILLTLILLILAVGCAALGYLVIGLSQSLAQQQQTLVQAQQRLVDLEQTLALTSDSAAQSGQTLTGRIGQLESQAKERYGHFDSEIAKLWTIAYQRNKPQLEEQGRLLAQQSEVLDRQSTQLEQQNTQLTALKQQLAGADKRVADLTGELKQLATLQKSVAGLEKQLASEAERMRKVSADAEFALSLERDERTKATQGLDARLDKLEGAQAGGGNLAPRVGGLDQRVTSIEQSIRAIDGSRRQFSQELLQVRQQLNALQLRLEQR